jgi:hypothetical protein
MGPTDTPLMSQRPPKSSSTPASLAEAAFVAAASDAALAQVRGGAQVKSSSQDSRALELESIKNDIQKQTQLQQVLANISNSNHDAALTAIRRIR